MKDNKTQFKLKVGIKQEHTKSLPLGKLQSRVCSALVLSFLGDNDQVSNLMQTINHKTRAYFQNSAGLKGFLVKSYASILQQTSEEDMKQMLKNQMVTMAWVLRELRDMQNNKERYKYLKKFPSLLIYVLTKNGDFDSLQEYQHECEQNKKLME